MQLKPVPAGTAVATPALVRSQFDVVKHAAAAIVRALVNIALQSEGVVQVAGRRHDRSSWGSGLLKSPRMPDMAAAVNPHRAAIPRPCSFAMLVTGAEVEVALTRDPDSLDRGCRPSVVV